MRQLLMDPKVRANLEHVDVRSPIDIIDLLLMSDRDLDTYVQGSPLNTDDRPRIEFSAPSNLYSPTAGPNARAMLEHLDQRTFEAPVRGLVSVTEGKLRAPFLNLWIQTDSSSEAGEDTVSSVSARWKVARTYRSDSRQMMIRRTNQGLLEWRKGSSNYQVLGQRATRAPVDDEIRNAIASALVGRIVGDGEVELPGGYRGLWGASPTPTRGGVALAVAWQCPFNGESDIRYLALQQFSDPGEAHWSEAAEVLASQFICTPL
jgi:hypothetical protein